MIRRPFAISTIERYVQREFWLIPMECGWVKSKTRARTRSKGQRKAKAKERAMKTRRVGSSRGRVATAENGITTLSVVGTAKRNRLTELETMLARSQFELFVCTGGHRCRQKRVGLFESRSENAEESWLGMVVGFVAINQLSMDSVTSVHVCPNSSATHATFVSQSLEYARGGVHQDRSARRSAQNVRCCP